RQIESIADALGPTAGDLYIGRIGDGDARRRMRFSIPVGEHQRTGRAATVTVHRYKGPGIPAGKDKRIPRMILEHGRPAAIKGGILVWREHIPAPMPASATASLLLSLGH